ncbi:hypothetical protein ALO91_103075 [Pseudomonas syringae pv. aceris]|uniref:Uncharacterized protein n=2 Tax=Pseudomonas syringae TaxID=317 RepID=A0A3M5LWW4_PSESX|nr:Unknown protein sequence [Pseudomonas syringae pv. aceris]KPW21807.1 hypothetical protein ALO91_103075 [Pseudomonas syringae pv. aceris]RMT52320.1 hypothetical protein ALP48_102576 [Pseudomonas syringae pv. solidagae]
MAQGKFHVQSPEILLFLAERSCPAGAFVTRMAKPECCVTGAGVCAGVLFRGG